MIRVIGPHDKRDPSALDVTSNSKSWGKDLSPFLLGPVHLYGPYYSQNVENAWQYSKVYRQHLEEDGSVSSTYWDWAFQGWDKEFADRYPMGKGAVPEFSLWDGKKLGYIEARKKIYLPLYARAVYNNKELWARLLTYYQEKKQITLFDYDGYDYLRRGMTLEEVINYEPLKMGHAFVLAMMLEDAIKM